MLILTTYDLDEYVLAALHAGASGFLLKHASPEELIAAVRTVAAGDGLLAPSVTRRLIEQFARIPMAPLTPAPQLGLLTEREREVLLLLARGRSNPEIAAEFIVGLATVKTPRRPRADEAGPARPRRSRHLRLRKRPDPTGDLAAAGVRQSHAVQSPSAAARAIWTERRPIDRDCLSRFGRYVSGLGRSGQDRPMPVEDARGWSATF